MANQPLILLASARKESDTAAFVQKVFQDTPHTLLDLLDYHVGPYRYENDYPIEDEFLKLIDQLLQHQVIVLATPVYWYAMSGGLKTFFDRLTDLVTVQKSLGRQLEGKYVFLMAVGADDALPDGFEVPFKLTAKYLHMQYGSSLYASTQELETDIYHLGNHREFLREIQDALQ
ncbi:NADPH-dependent oxidoreductase [Nibribacter ruber]|uniref:NADPH-dependent oxidoreductase n=1 Tax=Nibribacter ruber TaxID=2698458 RepID=A0A6P1P1D3_9BACT|nr:NAD(P)H-dependent oxidoreductase [Nibribacter ruber]QHL87052.1 NADPH-dependent oxidoreductase [Nibribacter ruber]